MLGRAETLDPTYRLQGQHAGTDMGKTTGLDLDVAPSDVEVATESDTRSDEQTDAQRREVDRKRFLERLMNQPALNLPKYTRDELYNDALG